MKVILSVKPEYVEKILRGTKRFEYRRRIFAREDVDALVIYSTSPVCAVVAEVSIEGIEEGSPEDLWKKTWRGGGIRKRDYFAYFKESEKGYAIRLGKVARFDEPIPLETYSSEVSRAPQSFAYVR